MYLDSASTTQKPESVIHAMTDFYRWHNANVHRGFYRLSQEATQMYEGARDKVRNLINAKSWEEIIFTRGTTEAVNLVVWTWGHKNIKRGDEILLTEMEHHSNLVPWQILAKKKGAKLKFIPVTHNSSPPPLTLRGGVKKAPSLRVRPARPAGGEGGGELRNGRLDLSNLDKLITKRTRIVSVVHASNVLGTINPVEKIIKAAHQKGAVVLVDGAQAAGHIEVDVRKLGCDFYAFSGHKMYGPTGIGILYGRKELLQKMPPYQAGGEMVKSVDWNSATWADLPWKFEAGTPNIAGAVGLGAAVDFLNNPLNPPYFKGEVKQKSPPLKIRGVGGVMKGELELTEYALKKFRAIPGLTIFGPQDGKGRVGVISFNVRDVPAHDLASILDGEGICVRAGYHCAMPLHTKLGVPATIRVSLGVYNTKADINKLIEGIRHARKLFA